MHIPVPVFVWAPYFDSVGVCTQMGKGMDYMETLRSAQQEVGRLFAQWLHHPGSHQPCGVWEGSSFSTSLPALVTVAFFFFFSIKATVGVRQPFPVAGSISLMTNDLEQSSVVLVFSFSLDPVLCRFPSPHTPLQTSSQPWASLQ